MSRFRRAAMIVLAALVSACGESSTNPFPERNPFGEDPPTGTTNGTVTARVNGVAWTGSTQLSQVIQAGPGSYGLQAFSAVGNTLITINLSNIGEVGTYPLGTSANVFGGSGQYVDAANTSWITPFSGVAGQINITTLTASRMRGTFSYSLKGSVQKPDSVLVISDGVFDLPIRGNTTGGPLPANAGSKFNGTFGTTPIAAADVWGQVALSQGVPQLFVSAGVIDPVGQGLSFTIQNYTGAGTYTFTSSTTPARVMSLLTGNNGLGPSWISTQGSTTATVTISSATTSRIVGTISGTLAPQFGSSATAPIAISGSFTIGLR